MDPFSVGSQGLALHAKEHGWLPRRTGDPLGQVSDFDLMALALGDLGSIHLAVVKNKDTPKWAALANRNVTPTCVTLGLYF